MLKMSYLINYLVEVQVPMLSKLSYFPTERERERAEGGRRERHRGRPGAEEKQNLCTSFIYSGLLF